MKYLAVLPNYLLWHYTLAFKDFRRVTDNLLWFIFNFFSIGVLSRTLFSPWRRLAKDETSAHANFFSNLAINVMMRISGFFIRLAVILAGLATFVVACVVFLAAFAVWLFLPIVVPALFLFGVSNFF